MEKYGKDTCADTHKIHQDTMSEFEQQRDVVCVFCAYFSRILVYFSRICVYFSRRVYLSVYLCVFRCVSYVYLATQF